MAKPLVEHEAESVTESSWGKWGKASNRRGLNHVDAAKTFVADFGIGAKLATEQFDKWLHEHGMLTMPPPDTPKNSDAWLGHLQRRHIMRGRINAAATHPRMTDEGSSPFIIVAIQGGFEVLAPQVAASKAELPRKLQTLVVTKRKQLSYLMQSADWSALPVHEQAIAETIYDDIDAFVVDTKTTADRISHKLVKLEHRIQMLMDAGTVVPRNGGLRQLIAPTVVECADDEIVGE
jgi:hypothetical protein